ncbi:PDR/VanB family oxidoreductase [Virgifigura deserti]|uniref:PDR/VanB family oxidoreductase n=1 Tax=Virgifigura deserti TaxID=2268457 RepID=UPI003CCBDE37
MSLRVYVTKVTDEAESIRSYELIAAEGTPLPAFTAGAHIVVNLPNGMARQYSLTGDAGDRQRYLIAVQRETEGRGGSRWIYDNLREGDSLEIGDPVNHFTLAEEAERHLLIAGGIGITPILAMASSLERAGADYHLVYCARRPARTAFRNRLLSPAFQDRVRFVYDEAEEAQRLDLAAILGAQPPGTHAYCCGPAGMIRAFRQATNHWPSERVHFELFAADPEAPPPPAEDQAFTVEIASTGQRFEIPPGRSILAVLSGHGLEVPKLCESGYCGSCLTGVLEGVPEHRDSVQSDAERAAGTYIALCCSRARSDLLVLDL